MKKMKLIGLFCILLAVLFLIGCKDDATSLKQQAGVHGEKAVEHLKNGMNYWTEVESYTGQNKVDEALASLMGAKKEFNSASFEVGQSLTAYEQAKALDLSSNEEEFIQKEITDLKEAEATIKKLTECTSLSEKSLAALKKGETEEAVKLSEEVTECTKSLEFE